VSTIAASSMITTERSGRSHFAPGWRPLVCSWTSLCNVSASVAAPVSSCRAAVADGPTPNTAMPLVRHASTAAASMRVLPAPAGPTTVMTGTGSLSITRIAAAWASSRPISDRGTAGTAR